MTDYKSRLDYAEPKSSYQGEGISEPTAYEQILHGFTTAISNSHSMLYDIEERVHRLLDMRSMDKSPMTNPGQEPILPDMRAKLAMQVTSAQQINERLERLLKHLSSIV